MTVNGNGHALEVWAPPTTRYDPFSLMRFPEYWDGAIAMRRTRLRDADDPQTAAIDRSEMIIARMTSEAPIPGARQPLLPGEREQHDVALARLQALRDAAAAGADPCTLPEFREWLAWSAPQLVAS